MLFFNLTGVLTGKLSDLVCLLLVQITQQIFSIFFSLCTNVMDIFLFVLSETPAIFQAVFTGYHQFRMDTGS